MSLSPTRARRRSLRIGTVLAVAAFTLYGLSAGGHEVCEEAWRIVSSPEEIRAYVDGLGLCAPVVFVLSQAVQVLVAVVPAGPLTLAGVVSFGFWGGFALSLGGAMLGSVAAFGIGRRWGRHVVARLVRQKTFDSCARKLGGREGRVVFAAMILPLPAGGDAVCALAGLSGISPKRFILVVLAGRLPGTAANALLASGLMSGLTGFLAASLAVLVLLVLTLVYKRRVRLRKAGGALSENLRPLPPLPAARDLAPVECKA